MRLPLFGAPSSWSWWLIRADLTLKLRHVPAYHPPISSCCALLLVWGRLIPDSRTTSRIFPRSYSQLAIQFLLFCKVSSGIAFARRCAALVVDPRAKLKDNVMVRWLLGRFL